MRYRVLVLGEDAVVLAGLYAIVEQAESIHTVDSITARGDWPSVLLEHRPPPDVLVVGTPFLQHSLIDVLDRVNCAYQGEAQVPRLLVIARGDDNDTLPDALRGGAHGYLAGTESAEDIVHGIHLVANGGATYSSLVARRLMNRLSAPHAVPTPAALPGLTEREREVLDLLARGLNNRQIGKELFLAEKTVRNHVTHIFVKLEVSTRATAVARARSAGLGGEAESVRVTHPSPGARPR